MCIHKCRGPASRRKPAPPLGPPDGAPPGNRRFAYYVDVRDVDQLYEELKPKLERLPKADVYGPVNQEYGQRELLVLAPDGNHPNAVGHKAIAEAAYAAQAAG